MKVDLESIIASAESIPPIPYHSAQLYSDNRDNIVDEVNTELVGKSDIKSLIGNNPLSMMYDNHHNHASFMSNVFKMNDFALMARVVIWAYRTYSSHGFSKDYFPTAMQAWIGAINKLIPAEDAKPLIAPYRWIIDNDQLLIEASTIITEPPIFLESKWQQLKEPFKSFLLEGTHKKAMQMASDNIQDASDLGNFYMHVIQPAMYDIGILWEKDRISVAQEHLASAIVTRVMASLYPRFIVIEQNKGKALVTAAPNEFHEIGPRMVADLLEIDGWDVGYLGANTPIDDLIDFMLEQNPFLAAVSVSMPFNIDKALEMVKKIKAEKRLNDTKIMLGGRTLSLKPNFKQSLDIDGSGLSALDAVQLADEWWSNAQ